MSTTAVRPDISIDFGSIELSGVLVHDDAQRALVLHTDEGPEPISVNLGAYGLYPAPGQIFIKDWSEHDGLAARMSEQGLVKIIDSVRVGPFSSRAYLVEVAR